MPPLKAHYEDIASDEIARRVREMDLLSSTSLRSPSHDPIFTPIFAAIGFTGSITIGTASLTTAQLLSAIATTSVVPGVHLLRGPYDGR